jgi:hypothetical protein
MQRLAMIIGCFFIVAASFAGTLYFLDSSEFQSFDAQRVEHGKMLKAALERYRAARGKYPAPFADNEITDLRPELVGGGFIDKLPVDPYWKNGRINKYRYRSDGQSYGLLFYFELGPCISGIGPLASAEWDYRKITSCTF